MVQHDPAADRRRTPAARILTPTLTVLLGSTAALCGMEMERCLLHLPPADQRRVALVYIDTDVAPSTLASFRRGRRSCVYEFTLRIGIPAAISRTEPGEHDQHTFIQGRIPQYYSNGAGGMRNNGHVAACFGVKQIHDTLDRALGAITQLDAQRGEQTVPGEVQVNAVAFLGGGTGSGILADIAVMLRALLANRQIGQRLNLFCLLPEQIQGSSSNDLVWRESNAVACLLELIAFGRAAAGSEAGHYTKYMRTTPHALTGDPLANEVYLIGHTGLRDPGEVARLVGLDLFMRTADASGVGFLEHGQWVDRRTLGNTDDRGLPTVFGSTCPLEVWFPAEETAKAFASRSAVGLLGLLAGYRSAAASVAAEVSEADRQGWQARWQAVAREDASAGAGDALAINPAWFRRDEFADATQGQIDALWSRLERGEVALGGRIQTIMAGVREQELLRMEQGGAAAGQGGGAGSLLHRRLLNLERLRQEYAQVLERMLRHAPERVPARPSQSEADLDRQSGMPSLWRWTKGDLASYLCEDYNQRLRLQARGLRHRALVSLLEDLLRLVGEKIEGIRQLIRLAGSREVASEMEQASGVAASAWAGGLDRPHPYQRHLFDLARFRGKREGYNVAVENLYLWATGLAHASRGQQGDDVLAAFVDGCVASLAAAVDAAGDSPPMTAAQVVMGAENYFGGYYRSLFEQMNLFEILDKALPVASGEASGGSPVGGFLLEHLKGMKALLRCPLTFEAALWDDGPDNLDTSLYLGMHWRNGLQRGVLLEALESVDNLVCEGQTATVQASLDPHRLQLVLGQHAISLTTVGELNSEHNSAMGSYLKNQREWEKTRGTGLMPVHSSGEAQRLVWDPEALGFKQPLPECIVRHVR